MRTKVEVEVSRILELVSCADTYGFARDVLLDGLAGMLGYECSDEEIAAHAEWFVSDEARAQGYGEEDRDEVIERCTEWRDKYATGRRKLARD